MAFTLKKGFGEIENKLDSKTKMETGKSIWNVSVNLQTLLRKLEWISKPLIHIYWKAAGAAFLRCFLRKLFLNFLSIRREMSTTESNLSDAAPATLV